MPKYHVEFDRIGRNHSVPPLDVERGNELGLLDSISKYARPRLASRGFDVVLDPCGTKGHIACGMHIAGEFSVSEIQPETPR